MNELTSGKRGGREVQEANLRPFKPGDVGNPKGHNQYTYRREFERAIDRYLAGQVSEDDTELLPEYMRNRITPDMTRGEALAIATIAGAFALEPKHLAVVLKRVWPETRKHQVAGPDGGPIQAQTQESLLLDNLSEEDREVLLKLAHKALMGGDGPVIDVGPAPAKAGPA